MRGLVRAFGLPPATKWTRSTRVKDLGRRLMSSRGAPQSPWRLSVLPGRPDRAKPPSAVTHVGRRAGRRRRGSRILPELALRINETLERLAGAASGRLLAQACGLQPRQTTLYECLPWPHLAQRASGPRCSSASHSSTALRARLQPDRSLVRRLLEAGLNVYLIDWGTPDDSERTGCTSTSRSTEGCVAQILERSGRAALDLLGVCQGGIEPVLPRCIPRAHRASSRSRRQSIHTPDNLLGRWVRGLDTQLSPSAATCPGVLNGVSVLGPAAAHAMRAPADQPPGSARGRGLRAHGAGSSTAAAGHK
jgi:hypothetical protein